MHFLCDTSYLWREKKWKRCTDGYPMVVLSKDDHEDSIAVHRLVALTFLDNPNNLPEVNHKDFNRWNPKLDNLEWCSHSDNCKYSQQSGRYKKPQYLGSGNPNAKRIRLLEENKDFDSMTDCAYYLISKQLTNSKINNITSQINKVCKNEIGHYLGLHFMRINN